MGLTAGLHPALDSRILSSQPLHWLGLQCEEDHQDEGVDVA